MYWRCNNYSRFSKHYGYWQLQEEDCAGRCWVIELFLVDCVSNQTCFSILKSIPERWIIDIPCAREYVWVMLLHYRLNRNLSNYFIVQPKNVNEYYCLSILDRCRQKCRDSFDPGKQHTSHPIFHPSRYQVSFWMGTEWSSSLRNLCSHYRYWPLTCHNHLVMLNVNRLSAEHDKSDTLDKWKEQSKSRSRKCGQRMKL